MSGRSWGLRRSARRHGEGCRAGERFANTVGFTHGCCGPACNDSVSTHSRNNDSGKTHCRYCDIALTTTMGHHKVALNNGKAANVRRRSRDQDQGPRCLRGGAPNGVRNRTSSQRPARRRCRDVRHGGRTRRAHGSRSTQGSGVLAKPGRRRPFWPNSYGLDFHGTDIPAIRDIQHDAAPVPRWAEPLVHHQRTSRSVCPQHRDVGVPILCSRNEINLIVIATTPTEGMTQFRPATR